MAETLLIIVTRTGLPSVPRAVPVSPPVHFDTLHRTSAYISGIQGFVEPLLYFIPNYLICTRRIWTPCLCHPSRPSFLGLKLEINSPLNIHNG